ncbi:hypothetical protein TI39_contig4204g00004 [Zymoseptoria brevis]|uniref:Uncharacterized protein n=1 Tax=Zymoseptoria brevis TaxID=1047168 RepID=A0A0F4GA52_9PEZI|nr:hypothetical protein TI39_contig4204g00004 [Zymoseptoria brevis]
MRRLEEISFSPKSVDFDRRNPYLLYFAQHLETAEDYCSWSAVRSPSLQHGIMHIAVPNELLDVPNCKWIYGEDWRQLVWESRGPLVGVAPQMWTLSAALQHYTGDDSMNMVLSGKICNTCDAAMKDLPGPHDIAAMPLNAGGKAQQYAFFRKAYAKLDDVCEGRIWIEERNIKSNNTTEQSSGKGMYRAKQEGA